MSFVMIFVLTIIFSSLMDKAISSGSILMAFTLCSLVSSAKFIGLLVLQSNIVVIFSFSLKPLPVSIYKEAISSLIKFVIKLPALYFASKINW